MEDKKIAIHAIPFDSEVSIDKETGHEVYDRVAHAQDLADWWAAYYSNGILVRGTDLLTNELQVLHLSAMACVVKPGMLVINGRTGIMKEELQLSFDVGESQPRIDRVVAELNLADRNVYIRILKGTPASSPQPVEITQNDDLYQIPLAQVHINAQQSVIASVTDERKKYISNVLLNKAPNTDVDASQVKVSDTVKSLYGLSTDNQNVDKALEKMQKGGLLSSVLTGFVKNSATGDITAGDTLANVLNKLQNRIKFGYGIVSGTERKTNMGDHFGEYTLPFVPVAVVIGDRRGTVLLTQNGLKSSTHFGQNYEWMYSLSGNIVKVESRKSIATEVTYFMI